ncbi:cytochrome c-type biogenesis protein [Parasphingorhabdus sp.]|uniref:cytochrome c-type biogenesis protein n=1 Tax=Parasphingorhabdus sp. TaxID=2709688 RepID=UPI002F94BAED
MRYILALILLSIALPAAAQTGLPPAPYADKQLADPAKEAAARDLMEELRCLKCQSQSIADSNAPMAGDMRSQVRERIMAGETPEQIRSWLIERYGSWVSYDPPVTPLTWPLWIAPVLLLILALMLARGRFRRKKDKD